MDYEATFDTAKNYDIFAEIIENNGLSGIDVLDFFTNYHGLQLLDENCTNDFIEEWT